MSRANRKGFTLVELLVVIGIIALLISILLPSLNKARGQAKAIMCASNLRQLGVAFQAYAATNKGIVPPSVMRWDVWYNISWDDLLGTHLGTRWGGTNDPAWTDFYGPYVGDQTGAKQMTLITKALQCPEDNRAEFMPWWVREDVRDRCKRSYSMVRNEWGNSRGETIAYGIGERLEYDGDRTTARQLTDAYNRARKPVRMGNIKRSTEIVVLVENFNQNVAGSISGAYVDTPVDSVPNYQYPQHGKVNNFLFLDGHVQTMTWRDSIRPGTNLAARPAQGMWNRLK